MRALRSLAFGAAVGLAMMLLLATNVGVWAFSRVLDPPALARTVAAVLDDPVVRAHVSRLVATGLAPVVLDQGAIAGPVRRALGLPARPTEAALADALAASIEESLAEGSAGDAMGLAAAAFAQVVSNVLHDMDASQPSWAERGLVVDLSPIGRLVLDRLDPSGALGGAIQADAVTVQLLDGPVLGSIVAAARLLDALRWLLPVACLAALAAILAFARFRVHALAWVGLCGVVAGSVSLLVASGVPVLVPRITPMDLGQATAVTAALDDVTATLVTQSAVLAGLGLALVVAGIAGGVVVAHGDARRGPRHEWDTGRLS